LSQIPIIKRSEEEIELRKEISQLKSDIKKEETKNQENQDKIARLEQEKQSLNLKCRKQGEQLEKMTAIERQLKNAQSRIKELESELGITIKTAEKSTQAGSGWEEEIKQKDLKIEELKQQLIKQKRPVQSPRSTFKDTSWANLSTEMKSSGGSLSPSQIKAREKQNQQEKKAQIIQAESSFLFKPEK